MAKARAKKSAATLLAVVCVGVTDNGKIVTGCSSTVTCGTVSKRQAYEQLEEYGEYDEIIILKYIEVRGKATQKKAAPEVPTETITI